MAVTYWLKLSVESGVVDRILHDTCRACLYRRGRRSSLPSAKVHWSVQMSPSHSICAGECSTLRCLRTVQPSARTETPSDGFHSQNSPLTFHVEGFFSGWHGFHHVSSIAYEMTIFPSAWPRAVPRSKLSRDSLEHAPCQRHWCPMSLTQISGLG